MPELPEVETVRRGLAPVMEGARVDRVELRRADLRYPFPERFAEGLQGRTIRSLGRRAKFLLIELDDARQVVGHLGMSGSFRIEEAGESATPGEFHHERSKDGRHDHAVFHLTRADGRAARVIYNDPRRFGFLLFAEDAAAKAMLARLGTEPTGNRLDGDLLEQLFKAKKTPLKAALLDQSLIAGLGNIYVSEALWRAGLSPKLMAGEIVGKRREGARLADLLATAIREVIAEAIAAGGSSLRDYVHADGSLGYFQHSFSVYDRAGSPCPRCGGAVESFVQAGRSTFYCRRCQP